MNRMYKEKEVAVKVWKEPLTQDVEKRYFIREVLAGCTMNHKNCLHYYGYSFTPEEEEQIREENQWCMDNL